MDVGSRPSLALVAFLVAVVGIAAAEGRIAGMGTAGRGRAAVAGGWAGAIAVGVVWVLFGGAETAVTVSQEWREIAEAARPVDPEEGMRRLGEWLMTVGVTLPVVFWTWLGCGTVAGAVTGGLSGRTGAPAPRLPATFAPVIVLLGSAFGMVLLIAALSAISTNLAKLVGYPSANLLFGVQVGSAALATALGALWTGWSAGGRIRHGSYTVRTSGAVLAGLGLSIVVGGYALHLLTNPYSASPGFPVLFTTLGVGAAIAGYRRGTGSEPVPTYVDGAREVLRTGLLGVALGYGAVGGTTGLMFIGLVTPQLPQIVRPIDRSDVPSFASSVTDLHWAHAEYGGLALAALVVVLAVTVFSSIALQRRYGPRSP